MGGASVLDHHPTSTGCRVSERQAQSCPLAGRGGNYRRCRHILYQVAALGGHTLGKRRNIEFALRLGEASKELCWGLLMEDVASHSLVGLRRNVNLI